MPIEAGATYVFDLGYYDYAWWAELDAAGCRIVTRFKSQHAANCGAMRQPLCPGRERAERPHRLSARPAGREAGKEPDADAVREIAVDDRNRQDACASSPTISTPRPRRSPISTSGAGRSNCSSA